MEVAPRCHKTDISINKFGAVKSFNEDNLIGSAKNNFYLWR